MMEKSNDVLRLGECPQFDDGTLVLAFTGWMDGGDVSTGTISRLVHLLDAREFAEIDPEPFYIYNFPGAMEVAALFRPPIEVKNGLIRSVEMPSNTFYCHEPAELALFIGKEPNLRWETFGEAIVTLSHQIGIRRILFVGSFGGAVPHTRQPRLYVTASDDSLLSAMEKYGLRRSDYEGPGSFTSYLMTEAKRSELEMVSLVAEIPGYLQGTNPMSIEAVTGRLAKILKLPLDLASLRTASTQWELQVSSIIEEDDDLAQRVRQLEDTYDSELLNEAGEEGS